MDNIDLDSNDESIKVCTVIDSAGCTITFSYTYIDEQNVIVEALKDKVSCPEPLDILGKILQLIPRSYLTT